MSFYTQKELGQLGLGYFGKNVKISKKASIYNPSNIEIGDNTRIDDFVVISAGKGGIKIGRNVHVAVFSSLIGKAEIRLCDYSNISSRVSIYSSNDDYSGDFMTNPTINEKFTNVKSEPVFIGKHVIVGSGSIILPGITLNTGVAVGALSLVTQSFQEFLIICGVPAKKIKFRNRNLIDIENDFLQK